MTRTLNLGAFSAPVAICGGVCSNLEAMTAFASEIGRYGIPADHVIHTGDVVAYCANPAECTDFLAGSGWHAIKGNVEQQLALDSDDCGCGFEKGTTCDVASRQWFSYARRSINDRQRLWMEQLPDHLTFTINGLSARVVHGSPDSINSYVFASSDILQTQFSTHEADIIIAGHCGIPFTRRLGGKLWHNSGSLGIPANDGTSRVWYSIIEPEGNGITISHHPLSYDHLAAAVKMQQAGLPQGYAKALSTGLWPALDILPDEERSATGKPLQGASYTF